MEFDRPRGEWFRNIEDFLARINERLSRLESTTNSTHSCSACGNVFTTIGHRNRHVRDYVKKSSNTHRWTEHKQVFDVLYPDAGMDQLRGNGHNLQSPRVDHMLGRLELPRFLPTDPSLGVTMGTYAVKPHSVTEQYGSNQLIFDTPAQFQYSDNYGQNFYSGPVAYNDNFPLQSSNAPSQMGSIELDGANENIVNYTQQNTDSNETNQY